MKDALSRLTLLLGATASCSFLFSCASIVADPNTELENVVAISQKRGYSQCSAQLEFDCIEVEILNRTQRNLEIPTSKVLRTVVVHPGFVEVEFKTEGGSWVAIATELATYDSPKRSLKISPGKGQLIYISASAPLYESGTAYLQYRVKLRDSSGSTFVSDAIDITGGQE